MVADYRITLSYLLSHKLTQHTAHIMLLNIYIHVVSIILPFYTFQWTNRGANKNDQKKQE